MIRAVAVLRVGKYRLSANPATTAGYALRDCDCITRAAIGRPPAMRDTSIRRRPQNQIAHRCVGRDCRRALCR